MINSIATNWVQFIRDNYPTYTVIDTALNTSSPDEYVLIRETGGTARRYPDNMHEIEIQIMVGSTMVLTAREMSYNLYNTIRASEHGKTLPALDASGHSEVEIDHIDVNQPPFFLGMTNSVYNYVFNMVCRYFERS